MTMSQIPDTNAEPRMSRTIALVSTHGSLRNWAEKRLYEPLVGRWNLEAIFWDRTHIIGPRGRDGTVEEGRVLRRRPRGLEAHAGPAGHADERSGGAARGSRGDLVPRLLLRVHAPARAARRGREPPRPVRVDPRRARPGPAA